MAYNAVPFIVRENKTLLHRIADVWQAKETNKFHLSKLDKNAEVTLFSNCSVIDWLLFEIMGLKKEILTEKAELSQCN